MQTYAILRRHAWADKQAAEQGASRSARVGSEEMPDRVRWIRSYLTEEEDGTLGSVCIYQGTDAEAIREHARRSGLPADEVLPIGDTVVVNEDPVSQPS